MLNRRGSVTGCATLARDFRRSRALVIASTASLVATGFAGLARFTGLALFTGFPLFAWFALFTRLAVLWLGLLLCHWSCTAPGCGLVCRVGGRVGSARLGGDSGLGSTGTRTSGNSDLRRGLVAKAGGRSRFGQAGGRGHG